MKTIGYLVFACFYYFFRILGRNKNKVFCIMTHDGSDDSSVGVVVSYLKKQSESYQFQYLRRKDTRALSLSFFVLKSYHLATSAYVLQDNIFLPLAYIRFPKDVKVVQLWHGTGTIKKFGQSVNTGQLKSLEKRANQRITHLIVNSNYTKKLYQEAFGVEPDKIFLLGLPRTDILFDEEKKRKDLIKFYKEYPMFTGKKIILYAPTFRDNEVDSPQIRIDFTKLMKEIPEEYILILKLHPFVATAFQMDELDPTDKDRVWNFSTYEDLNTLLFASEILITDYSSIIFEYSLLEKPIIFYAYDLKEFSMQGRGFYENYRDYVPGPVAMTTKEIVTIIKKENYDINCIKKFKNQSYQYLDGQSTERLFGEIFHFI